MLLSLLSDSNLIILTIGMFLAAFVNAAFATGGIYIALATTTAIFPLTIAIPLQSVFSAASLVARIVYFWEHINWKITLHCSIGAAVGVYAGSKIFVNLPEATIAISLGCLLLFIIWMPKPNWQLPFKHPFVFIGGLHAFLATLFGVGSLMQPTLLRSQLLKLQITATLATCMLVMDVFKIIGFMSIGFDYTDYIPHIICASIAGFAGTWVGKRVTHLISESLFRQVFKFLITLVALRLLYKGWQLLGSGQML